MDPKQKLTFLKKVKQNLLTKIYDIDIEIRVWEREKISATDQQLLYLQTMVDNCKTQKKFFEKKLEIVLEEIKYNGNLVGEK